MVNKILFFYLLCIIFFNPCAAQSANPNEGFGLEFNIFSGKVIKHTAKFELPIPALTTGADINCIWKTNGEKDWQQRRRYPTIGIGLTYTDYGIDSVYGRCFSVYPNITFPIISGRRMEWTLRIGDGCGYVTKIYSRVAPLDTLNNAIGSHINDYATFNTDIRYHLNSHWDLQIGGNFSHISNASFKQPNLGVNLLGTHIGIRYFPYTSAPRHIFKDLKPLKNRWGAAFNLAVAFDQPPPAGGPKFPVYLASFYITKRWVSKNKFFTGIDYSYHESIYTFLRNNYIDAGTEALHSYKSAVIAGNEFLLGKVGVVLQLGYYIKNAYLSQGNYYEKLGANLYLYHKEHGLIRDVFLCAFLKAHIAVAELSEYGFGVGF